MIIHEHQDRTLRSGKPEHQTKHNTWTEHEHNLTGPKRRTPNTPEHNAEHVQKLYTEQNNEHGHVFYDKWTMLIASPGTKGLLVQTSRNSTRATQLILKIPYLVDIENNNSVDIETNTRFDCDWYA